MVALRGTIYIVIFSVFLPKGNPETIKHLTVNLTAGSQGLLKCPHPLTINNKPFSVYWTKDTRTICFENSNVQHQCEGFQHEITKEEIILTIPKVKDSDTGSYICYVNTENESFECRIELRLIPGSRMLPNSGVHIKAGPIFLLLPLLVVSWNLPWLLL